MLSFQRRKDAKRKASFRFRQLEDLLFIQGKLFPLVAAASGEDQRTLRLCASALKFLL
jgi:hypothetical protein